MVASGLALAGAAAAAPGASNAPNRSSYTFFCTGGEQTYVVPNGVRALAITAVGAPGGAAFPDINGGSGARVTATIPMSALPKHGTTLYVEVGCAGNTQDNPGQGGIYGSGGFNGGGFTSGADPGGGGGASDVRTTSMATIPDAALTTSNDSRVIVAGGGGGEGTCQQGYATDALPAIPGGSAGDPAATGPGAGGNGYDSANCVGATFGGDGGFGGAAGGAGGLPTSSYPCVGGSGSLALGGSTDLVCSPANFGGGGGGGYYGGGAGGDAFDGAGGGGAGSSYWVPAATSASMRTDTTGTPEVVITPV